MRSLIADEEQSIQDRLSAGIFKDKNNALLHVYQRYMALPKTRKAVDAATLIRRASTQPGRRKVLQKIYMMAALRIDLGAVFICIFALQLYRDGKCA